MMILPVIPAWSVLPFRDRKVRRFKDLSRFCLGLAAAIVFAAPAIAADAAIRFGSFDGAARVILEGPTVERADIVLGETVTITLPGVSAVTLANEPVGLIRNAAIRRAGDGFRLVLTTEGRLGLRERRVETGQAVFDLVPATAATAAAAKPAAAKSAVMPIIVIDAGHGGVDPGAISADGTREKEITLATAKTLRGLLEKQGFRVVMTRSTDVFLPLRRRVEIARGAAADLFISLHADSLDRADKDAVGGASIYTLSETASDAEAQRLAERENRVDALYGQEIDGADGAIAAMLFDFAMRGKLIDSRRFAETLAEAFRAENIRLLRNPLRSAGFAVLTAPDVPAVLVELGFLSNPKDQALLRDARHRERLARALAASVDRYFATVAEQTR